MAISQRSKLKLNYVKKFDEGDWARIWKQKFRILTLKICLNLDRLLPISIIQTTSQNGLGLYLSFKT